MICSLSRGTLQLTLQFFAIARLSHLLQLCLSQDSFTSHGISYMQDVAPVHKGLS